ncbi:MAG: hypothetical protein JRI70_10270, partial [Deltaproteobacteria bacterium]|nr:hypothetical protein [Deltaproteobacteria bacterium]
MYKLQGLFIKVIAIAVFIALFPGFALAAGPWDPGKKLYGDYVQGTVKDAQNFPVYIFNFTPYDVKKSSKDIQNWFLPDTIPAKGMGIGFLNNFRIYEEQTPILNKKPFDLSYRYTIMDGNSPNPTFVMHLLSDDMVNPPALSKRTGIFNDILLGNKLLAIPGMIPVVGVFFRSAKMVIGTAVLGIKMLPPIDLNFYILGYGIATVADCQPSITYYPDYCSSSKYNQSCSQTDKNKPTACFDSAYAHIDSQTCKDINDPNAEPDPITNYIFGNSVFAGAPFYNHNDKSQQACGTMAPYFTFSIYMASDWNAGSQQLAVEELQARGFAKEGTKLNTLINLVSNNSLVEQSALMDKIGVAKAAEIT